MHRLAKPLDLRLRIVAFTVFGGNMSRTWAVTVLTTVAVQMLRLFEGLIAADVREVRFRIPTRYMARQALRIEVSWDRATFGWKSNAVCRVVMWRCLPNFERRFVAIFASF